MRKYLIALALVSGFLGASRQVRAQVQVNLPPNLPPEFVTATGMPNEQAVRDFIEQKFREVFQIADPAGFLRKLGDSQSFTSKGMGVDYASEATYFEVGASVSFAMGIDRTYQPGDMQGFPIQGVGLNASIMAGVSLDSLGIPLMIFGNFMKIPSMSYGAMSGSLNNWGVHAQLRLLGPDREETLTKVLVRWGGIAITTGIDSSHMALGLNKKIKSTFAFDNPQTTLAVTADSNATFDVDMTTRSIPLEVTTSLRLLSLLTVYGGLGFDWQLGGGSNMNLDVSAALAGNSPLTGPVDLGTASVRASYSADPSSAKIRGILGVQANLWLLRIFTQLNVTNSNPMMASLAAGLRLAY